MQLSYDKIEDVIKSIKALEIQGNTNIAKTCVRTLLDFITDVKPSADIAAYVKEVKKYGQKLTHARANEPLAINAVTYITKGLESCKTYEELRVKFLDRVGEFFKYIDESYEIIRVNGENLLKGFNIIYTHCHSSLSRDVLIRIGKSNPKLLVINDETRPMYQGRITAEKLNEAEIKLLHVVDSMASSIFLDPRYPKPEAVLVGSDGITIDGDLINKVGTFNIALAAKEANIPFFAIAQTMKIDLRSVEGLIEIERRNPAEIWKKKLKNMEIINPAFDQVPAKYITGGYITEKGLLKPHEFRIMM